MGLYMVNLQLDVFGESEGHLGRIGVAKTHQRKGWGKFLMTHAIEWFRNEGITEPTYIHKTTM